MIKASYELLQPASGQSFLLRKFGNIAFDAPYHFHPEYELTYIIAGTGKRYVGNHMENFYDGDLVLLGPNLPHCWKIDEEQPYAAAIVVQFPADFLGESFFDCTEMINTSRLFQQSTNGIYFSGEVKNLVANKLELMVSEKNNFKILMHLLEVFESLAAINSYKLLDQQPKLAQKSAADHIRINPVLAYLVDNFRNQVSLDEAAGIANMTSNAFCKYFKKTTRKTFMEMVIDYRLNYAKQQLVQTDKPISEISFESGFGDISHFYKTFKIKMELSPYNYRKKFMEHLGNNGPKKQKQLIA